MRHDEVSGAAPHGPVRATPTARRAYTDAVRYLILIMFMIAACVGLATCGVVLLAYRRLLSADHRLRTDRLRPARA